MGRDRMMKRRQKQMTETTDAVDWTISEGDDFDCRYFHVNLSAAATTEEDITLTVDSGLGASNDTVVRTVDATTGTSFAWENLEGFANGDKLRVQFANSDGLTVNASAVLEV